MKKQRGGNSGSLKPGYSVNHSGAVHLRPEPRSNRRLPYALLITAVLIMCIQGVAAQRATTPHPGGVTISGTVHNSAGQLVGDASVRLAEKDASIARETKTNAEGQFAFSGLGTGTYVLTAEKPGLRSRTAVVLASSPGDHKLTSLVLEDSVGARANSSKTPPPSDQAMEFADNPNFTVAAVTDWTAAGGHGSDSILRTSEALTRETLTLKSQDAKHAAPAAARNSNELKEFESRLRTAQASDPGSFETNHNLGAFYLHADRYRESIAPLQTAYRIDPGNYDNEYDLVLACKGSGDFSQAREHVNRLLAHRDSADLHRLAAELDEKLGNPLAAVHEYEQAVREDPSEQNYFEWGSELLFHRAVWQAKAVFEEGVRAYPKSARMLTALGTALFAGALYDEAALRLCDASDLNPADPDPYIFMGKIEMASPNPLACVEQKLARFVRLQPNNALANYFYAMTIWKQQGQHISQKALEQVEAMLTKAVVLDHKCSDAYLQLGNLNASQRDYQKAIGFYQKAIEANPQLSEAHYRLGMAYDRAGEQAKAKQEFQLHDELQKQQAAAVERQRREIKQFLVVEQGKPAAPSTQQ